MKTRIAAIVVGATLVMAAPASGQQPAGPYAPWDGSNPFNCVLQDAGTGTTVPDPDADPYCVEFDKNSQNVAPNFGIVDFFANEPARVAAASPKCFYYQTDHWTGSLVQGEPPELWHWDGQYFFDKAIGAGGVNLQNFRVAGQPASLSDYGQVPPEFAPFMDQSGGGAYTVGDVPADPNCAAMVDTEEERQQIYKNGQPPPTPDGGPGGPTAVTAIAGLTATEAKRCLKKKRKSGKRKGSAKSAKKKKKRRCGKRKSKRKRR